MDYRNKNNEETLYLRERRTVALQWFVIGELNNTDSTKKKTL